MTDIASYAAIRDTTERRGSNWRRVSRLSPVFVVLVLVLAAVWEFSPVIEKQSSDVATALAILLSAFLSLLPALICIVQNITRRRQHNRLST